MEAGKTSVAVTYDLAIAKVAIQILSQECPKYDQLFINLGTFYIELAFFKALEKFVVESREPYVLQEAKVLAEGSIRSFLEGTNCS